MQNKDTTSSVVQESSPKPARERVGLVVNGTDASAAVSTIVAAEAAGVRQVWMIQTPSVPDTLTIFAAAAMQTTSMRMGTAIVPTYPRHPLVMVQQALALGDLAPERLRLGIGPSHRPTIEGIYGIPMTAPLVHLREYVTVLRTSLWEGKIDHQGRFFTIKATLPRAPHTPILISALRKGAFQLAGEIADGAISWMCPVPYLLENALPALRTGAARSIRPVPPLLAHIPVALGHDRHAVLAASRKQISRYAQLPFYANMFADAGFPVGPDGTMSDELIDSLVVSGDEAAITTRLTELLAVGLDELLVMPILVTNPASELERLMRLIGRL
jgi:alkanesulfonate monooxygenase SsuD/methylene tetrahydromethanopterin reductase-like flavin-dependent oxidoreductase (luciferase family)